MCRLVVMSWPNSIASKLVALCPSRCHWARESMRVDQQVPVQHPIEDSFMLDDRGGRESRCGRPLCLLNLEHPCTPSHWQAIATCLPGLPNRLDKARSTCTNSCVPHLIPEGPKHLHNVIVILRTIIFQQEALRHECITDRQYCLLQYHGINVQH